MKERDQRDKILVSFCTTLQEGRVVRGEEIESHPYFLLLHLSSSAFSTSPLVIYLLQHGFSAY